MIGKDFARVEELQVASLPAPGCLLLTSTSTFFDIPMSDQYDVEQRIRVENKVSGRRVCV